MVISDLLVINQHENKWCCASETSTEVYIFKINSALENELPLFAWHGKFNIIHELRSFGCDIYTITPNPKKLYNRTKL